MRMESVPQAKSSKDVIREGTIEGLQRAENQRELSEQMIQGLIDSAQIPQQIDQIRKLLDRREKRIAEERK